MIRNRWTKAIALWTVIGLLSLSSNSARAQPDARPLEFNGRLQARQAVEFRTRVNGYLTKVNFKEGAFVKTGEVLFEIDPRIQQLAMARAEAEVRLAEARKARIDADRERAKKLAELKAISQEELQKLASEAIEAEAAVGLARINLDAARLELDFTRIRSPIDGRIGAALVTPGNLVTTDKVLAEAHEVDVLYVYFDMDERTYLQILRAVQAKNGRLLKAKVSCKLVDGKEYSHPGEITFVDNRLNPETGAIRIRATLPNPEHLLAPGMFVRVSMRLDVGDEKK